MKNIKKIMLSFGTMAAIAAPISAVVACNNDKKKDDVIVVKELTDTQKAARIALFDAIVAEDADNYGKGVVAEGTPDTLLGVKLSTHKASLPTVDAEKIAILDEVLDEIGDSFVATQSGLNTKVTITGFKEVEVTGVAFNKDFTTTFMDSDDNFLKLFDAIMAANKNAYVMGTGAKLVKELKPSFLGVDLDKVKTGTLVTALTDEEKIAAIELIKARITLAEENTDKTKTDFTVDGYLFTVDKVTFNKDVKTTLGL